MNIRIGVIAEDDGDVGVLAVMFTKISPSKKFAVKKFVGHGCGRIASKCHNWARNLKIQGCHALVVMHDLDNRNIQTLHEQLISALQPSPIPRHIVIIPIRELEAWLLSDAAAIQNALNLKNRPARVANPEAIMDAKRHLKEIVFLKSEKTKRFISTVHNVLIARKLNLKEVRRCSSFQPLEDFIRSL
jgi:hypothetical protein